VRVIEAVELVACHVFNLADRDDQRVSMEMVRQRQFWAAAAVVCAPGVIVSRRDHDDVARTFTRRAIGDTQAGHDATRRASS